MATPDSSVLTAATKHEPDNPVVVSADDLLVTPTSGTQQKLSAALVNTRTSVITQTMLVPITMASLANAQVFQIDPGYAGTLSSINFRDTVAVTTDSKAATVQAQVATVAVTGGAIALSGKYAVGAAQAGSAITAGNTFTSSQTIGFSISSVTTFAEGAGVIEMTTTQSVTSA